MLCPGSGGCRRRGVPPRRRTSSLAPHATLDCNCGGKTIEAPLSIGFHAWRARDCSRRGTRRYSAAGTAWARKSNAARMRGLLRISRCTVSHTGSGGILSIGKSAVTCASVAAR